MSRTNTNTRTTTRTTTTRKQASKAPQTATTIAPARKRVRTNQGTAAAPAPNPGDPGASSTQTADDDDDDNEDNDDDPPEGAETGEKRKSTFDEPKNHPLNKPGRHFGRIEEAFARIKPILELGMFVSGQESQVTDLNEEETKWLAQFRVLEGLVPDLQGWIEECGVTLVANQLTQARKNARGEDAKKAKDKVHMMKAWTPSLVGLPKDRRGMHHREIADLIIPPYDRAALNGEDLTVSVAILSDYTNGVRLLDPEVWPAFMYHKHEIFAHNVWRGAFRSAFLVLFGRLLFFGSRSLMPGAPMGGKCVATIWGMKEMTIGGLCYLITMAFFALSSDTEFQPVPGANGFSYKRFYDQLKDSLESQTEERRVAILTWWNQQMFSSTNTAVIPRPDGAKTAAELLKEQGVQDDDDLLEE